MEDFVTLLKRLFLSENGYPEEEAGLLIKTHSAIIVRGIMSGLIGLRATAMALEMAEESK